MVLVSIVIPTLNEEKSLPLCLESIERQTEQNLEIVVVDSGSTDATREIAIAHGAVVVSYRGGPLGARLEYQRASAGDYILFMDADQVLKTNDVIARALECMRRGFDALILDEESYMPASFLQRLLSKERQALHNVASTDAERYLHPRLFRRQLLDEALHRIPSSVLPIAFAFDDIILHVECERLGAKIGRLGNGLLHIDERSFVRYCWHWYLLGKTAKRLWKTQHYSEELKDRTRFDAHAISRHMRNGTLPLALVRYVGFEMGWRLS